VARVRKVLIAAGVVAVGVGLALATRSSDGRGPEPARSPTRPNVVMLIFDEFPGDALLGEGGRIDSVRYPNFAALARDSYWFRNAWSSYDSTPKAVPLIMDGLRPSTKRTADAKGHPHTIFDLFGRRGYRMTVSEEATAVCPQRYCPGNHKKSIIDHLGSDRPKRLEAFFRTIKPGKRPGFWLKHVLLPHNPYRFLPDGRQTTAAGADPIKGLNRPVGFGDEFLTRHNEQRFLWQVGFVDRELGKLLGRLRDSGMYDDTMIVVIADHGFAWQTGVKDRRRVRDSNVAEIGPVPFFVKMPGRPRRREVHSLVQTMDVTPTIADLLNKRLPYRPDGKSAFSSTVRNRRTLRIPSRDFDFTVRISGREWERRRQAVVARRLRMFGSGDAGFFDGIGPNRELVGRTVDELRTAGAARVRGSLAGAAAWRRVSRASGAVPVEIAGDIRGARRGAKRDVAVAVNGRVEAVGRTFYLDGDRTEHFAMNVPEESMHDGRNDVQVFEVDRGPTLRLAARD
jgi:arylsulfatase A-like enzyme